MHKETGRVLLTNQAFVSDISFVHKNDPEAYLETFAEEEPTLH